MVAANTLADYGVLSGLYRYLPDNDCHKIALLAQWIRAPGFGPGSGSSNLSGGIMPASMQSLTQLAESIHNPAIAQDLTALRARLVEIQQEAQELIERLDLKASQSDAGLFMK